MYCENCRALFWKRISKLPNELCRIIFTYVRDEEKIFLNTTYYNKYHHLFVTKIKTNYDNYVRDIIRRDNDFVLKQLLNENYNQWLKKRKLIHKSIIYSHYSGYLLGLSMDNESNKCKELINHFYDTKGLSKNLHKKNRNSNKRWIQ